MQRSTIARNFTVAVVTALALGLAPTAKADNNKGCSNASLKGTFVDKDSGWIFTSPTTAPVPFAGVNIETFDGNGTLTGTGMASVNGNIMPGSFKGTYTVNPDCTGTYTTESPGLTVHAFFVIADNGNELQIVITNPGTVIGCIARRQFPAGDWRQ